MLEKPKLIFDIGSITMKACTELSGKEIEKYPRKFFLIMIVWMVIYAFFEQCETHKQLKERETF